MNKYITLAACAFLTAGLGACGGSGNSPMSAGERLSERGGEIAQYGDDWSAGNKAVREGEKLIAKSTDQIADARKKLAKAEADQARARQMITEGKISMERSEAEYAAARAGPPAIPAPQSE